MPLTGFERAGTIARATLIVIAILVLTLVAWRLAHVLLLAFAAIIVATILVSLGNAIAHYSRLPPRFALIVAGLLTVVLVIGFVYLLGAQIRAQTANLIEALPLLVDNLGVRFGVEGLYQRVIEQLQEWAQTSGAIQNVFGVTFGIVGVVAELLVVVAAGFYLGARPAYHHEGFLKLFPKGGRERVEVAGHEAGRALELWLVGQLIAMLLVGTLTTLGLMLLGVPSALALGFIAGIAEFVPMVGPFLAAIPALLVGLSAGENTFFYVAAVFIVVQQLEGNLITPLIQRRAVDLPPVLALFAVIALGTLFGPLGILLATPLTVVLLVLVKQLYIRDTLHETTKLPGEKVEA